MSTKGKRQERPGFYTLIETSFLARLLITQDLNKIKNPENPFADTGKSKRLANFFKTML